MSGLCGPFVTNELRKSSLRSTNSFLPGHECAIELDVGYRGNIACDMTRTVWGYKRNRGKEMLLSHGLSALVIAFECDASLRRMLVISREERRSYPHRTETKKKKRDRAFPAQKRNQKAQLEHRRSAREKSSSSFAGVYSSILCESIDCLRKLRH